MSTITFAAGTEYGNSLKEFLLLPEITPGDEPSYQACKTVYTHHPLGMKMAETPIIMAQSQEREISAAGAPSTAIEAFKDEFRGIGASEAIRQTKVLSRVYGIASCGVIAEGVPPDRPLQPKQLRDLRIAFNVWDPLNTAGSLVFNQNPNALDFMKQSDSIAVSGQRYHPSRTIVVVNERPIYLSWTSGAYGFVGRSVYQRAWYPLKSFLKTMVTDDMIATKAGVIVAKIKQPGSFADNIMATAFGQKRDVVKEAQIGNVINCTPDEAIESLDLMNTEGPMTMARGNILKNCAVGADMPAVLLNEETFVEGFGEGTEDARRVAMYVKRMREEMNPQYEWFDEIAMQRAWGPDFYATVQRRYPNVFGAIPYTQAFYAWKNSFKAQWPNWLEEEDSEKIRTQEVILNAAVAVVQTLLPVSDPANQAAMCVFLADTINDQDMLFKTPLELDIDTLEAYLEEQKTQKDTQQQNAGGGQGGGEGGAFGAQKVPQPKRIGGAGGSADSYDDKVSHALNRLHDSVERLPSKDRERVRKLEALAAQSTGIRK